MLIDFAFSNYHDIAHILKLTLTKLSSLFTVVNKSTILLSQDEILIYDNSKLISKRGKFQALKTHKMYKT